MVGSALRQYGFARLVHPGPGDHARHRLSVEKTALRRCPALSPGKDLVGFFGVGLAAGKSLSRKGKPLGLSRWSRRRRACGVARGRGPLRRLGADVMLTNDVTNRFSLLSEAGWVRSPDLSVNELSISDLLCIIVKMPCSPRGTSRKPLAT